MSASMFQEASVSRKNGRNGIYWLPRLPKPRPVGAAPGSGGPDVPVGGSEEFPEQFYRKLVAASLKAVPEDPLALDVRQFPFVAQNKRRGNILFIVGINRGGGGGGLLA